MIPARGVIRVLALAVSFLLLSCGGGAQQVFVVVIDGGRYAETFGSQARYLPHIWNDLRPQGTIYTNFRNDGVTETCSGFASLLTGTWQKLRNNGSERPDSPTLFEYYRKQTSQKEASCLVVSGKPKLAMLTHSRDSAGPALSAVAVTNPLGSDTATWRQLAEAMDRDHPRVVIVNFPEVDLEGHDGRYDGYLAALRRADSLVHLLWLKIQSDSVYRNTTTMFVTNDHGRHDDAHGGFRNHGDTCEGCRHIMLLAVGPGIARNAVVQEKASQVDIAPTAAAILKIRIPGLAGRNLNER